ncbi:hypothetical protein ACFU3E_22255 [Streptomyces sp. NPDC057424]|uniref:hypothetical protein n=1 Tax=Streptomyces sp. NPDC057424 TaxID=3346127 RepID=UPI0036B4CF4F
MTGLVGADDGAGAGDVRGGGRLAARRPGVAGGGVIVISAAGDGSQSYTKRCVGGVHDGETLLPHTGRTRQAHTSPKTEYGAKSWETRMTPVDNALVEVDMNQETSRSSDLPQPLRAVAAGLRHLPGAEQVGKVATDALDRIGAVSPRGRRMAVYAGAGVLGVAGLVEWPVAVTGAAVAWLTQPRPERRDDGASPNGGTQTGGTGDHRSAQAAHAGRDDEDTSAHGPGGRLTSSHYRHDRPEHHVHEQPAKVGDTATASALKQVAEATAHHGEEQPGGHAHDSRPTG